MKKVLMSVAVAATLGMATTSCGIDTEAAADEFCACKDAENGDECRDQWIEKYKDAKASQEDAEAMGKKMAECDPANALSTLMKAAEGK